MPVVDEITLSLVEREYERGLKKEVELELWVGKELMSESLVSIAESLRRVSRGKIKYKAVEGKGFFPAVRILKNLLYMGVPTGLQFGVFTHFLLDLSRKRFYVGDELMGKIRGVKRDVEILVFTTPGCPHSPQQVRWVYEFAAINSKISARVIDVGMFPKAALRYAWVSKFTPSTLIDNRKVIRGVASPDEILRKISE